MACAQRESVRYVHGIIVIGTHVLVSGSVCRGFEEVLCTQSLTRINTHGQSLTGEPERIFTFRLRWVPSRRVLSFGLSVTNTFVRQCYIGTGL